MQSCSKGANTVASILFDYIENNLEIKPKKLKIYYDNCGA
jgi:hypothetical protein